MQLFVFLINAYRVSVLDQFNVYSTNGNPILALAAAELAIAIVAFLFCLAFIVLFIMIAIRISRKF